MSFFENPERAMNCRIPSTDRDTDVKNAGLKEIIITKKAKKIKKRDIQWIY